MISKIVLSIVAASVAFVPVAAFAKSEKSARHASKHHVSRPAATPAAAARAAPAATPVKMTPATNVFPKKN